MIRPRSVAIALFASILCAVVTPAVSQAATTPALTAFEDAWAHVNDYTVNVHAHEILGNDTQDRIYQFSWKRPHQAKTLIIEGDGRGSGGVWNGGDRVSGHQGGFLSRFHLKVDLHDHRAVSLRGYTIPQGLIMNQIAQYKDIKGKLVEKAGANNTQEVTLEVANPATSGTEAGVTRMSVFFSKATHMPVRQLRWAGAKVVTDETWTDLKTNVGLSDGDFPF